MGRRRYRTSEERFLRRLYQWSFLMRFGIGIAGWFATLYLQLPFLQDALAYDEAAANVAGDWLNGRSSWWLAHASEAQPRLMVAAIACFYVLTFGVRLLPLLIAAYSALTALVPARVYAISRLLGASESAARTSAWVVALMPAFAFWSGALYKEGALLLLLGIVIEHALRLQSAPQARSLAIVIACIAATFFLRFYLAAILLIMVGAGITIGRGERSSRAHLVMIRQGLVALFFGIIAVFLVSSPEVRSAIPFNVDEAFERINASRQDLASADSGYLPDGDVSTPEKAVRFLPLGAAYFLAVPLPWQWGSLRQSIAIPDTTVWLVLYPIVILGMAQAMRRNYPGVILIAGVSLAIVALYGLFIANVGTAFRLRIQVWFLWAPFVGMGLEALRARRRLPAMERRDAFGTMPTEPASEPTLLPRKMGKEGGFSVAHNGCGNHNGTQEVDAVLTHP